ncbi:MAG: FGGY-family carbohydrate kinase [Thermoguttaceae bacterium]
MKSDVLLLGLDLGTTNVKAVVTTGEGRVLAQGSAPVQLFHVGHGAVEQDLEEIASAALAAIRAAADGVDASRIRAIGVSSQGGAMQILDGQGRPSGRVVSWLDRRGSPYDDAITAELGRTWLVDHIARRQSGQAIGQLLRLRREAPALLDRPNRIGFVGDAIVARLCGRAAHDATSHGLTLLYNPARGESEPELLKRLGIDESQLPDLLSPRDTAAVLLEEVARQTGLEPGIPVSPAIHDQYAAALGCGANRPRDVMLGTGTAWVLLAVTDRLPQPVIDEAFICTHVVEGLFGQILSLVNGGSALDWARRLLGMHDAAADDLDRVIASVAPGSEGLRCVPLLASGGGAGVTPETRGALTGLQLAHGPAHVLRAVVEGLACELTRYLEFLAEAEIAVDRLILCGKAATSQTTPQILADVTGLPVACSSQADTSALGAAIIARGLLEPAVPLDTLAQSMVSPSRQVLPGPDADVYRPIRAAYLAALADAKSYSAANLP